MQHVQGMAMVCSETIHLPTYGIGKADKNPMFLEKRVYQGSSGIEFNWPPHHRTTTYGPTDWRITERRGGMTQS